MKLDYAGITAQHAKWRAWNGKVPADQIHSLAHMLAQFSIIPHRPQGQKVYVDWFVWTHLEHLVRQSMGRQHKDRSLPELICSLPHSSGPRWRSAEAEVCPFWDASPQGCYGTSKAAAPPAWWCLLPGSWFDWPRGTPPLPADASSPEDGETKRNDFQMLSGRHCDHIEQTN